MSRASNIVKGTLLEIERSYDIHKKCVPLLICPTMLRRVGCGQVDISGIFEMNGEFFIRLYEVKSSGRISERQYRRLMSSAHFVSSFFDISCGVSLV